MSAKFAARAMRLIALPVGALCLAAGLAAPNRAMTLLGVAAESSGQLAAATTQTVVLSCAGAVGAVLIGVGMIQSARHPWSSRSRLLLLIGAIGFLLAVLFCGYANMRLMRSLGNLASAESIDMDSFRSEVEATLAPTLTGGAGLLLGALAILTAGWHASTEPPINSPTRRVAFVGACGCSLLICLAALGLATAAFGLHEQLNSSQSLRPLAIARSMTAILYAGCLMLLSIAGFGGVLFVQRLAACDPGDSSASGASEASH